VQSLKQLCAIHEEKIASMTIQLEQHQAAQLAKKSSSSSFDAGTHPVAISLQKHIDQLSAEKLQAEQTIKSLQHDLHASQTENAQRAGHERQVKTLTDLSKALRQQLADAKTEIDHLQAANRLLHEQIQRLQSSDQNSSKSLQNSVNEDSLQQALRVANEYREKSDAEFKAYQVSSEQAIADLKRDLQLVEQKLAAKETQLQEQGTASQSRSLSINTSSHTETSTHLKSEQFSVTNVTRVVQLTDREDTDITALQRMLQEAEGRIIELELMISKMREDHQTHFRSLSLKVQASEDLSVKFRRDHASSETLLMDAKQELSGLRPRYDAALAKLSAVEPQLEKLRTEYSTVTSRLSVSETRCSELSTVSEGLRSRLSVAEQACLSLFLCLFPVMISCWHLLVAACDFRNHVLQMCGSLSDESSALKVFISKLQSQLSDALSEANGLRGNSKSLEAKIFELMSETQMYRGQIDELQVIVFLDFRIIPA
jgi:chromosome segregation ATPase